MKRTIKAKFVGVDYLEAAPGWEDQDGNLLIKPSPAQHIVKLLTEQGREWELLLDAEGNRAISNLPAGQTVKVTVEL